jgi:hypothetical protein
MCARAAKNAIKTLYVKHNQAKKISDLLLLMESLLMLFRFLGYCIMCWAKLDNFTFSLKVNRTENEGKTCINFNLNFYQTIQRYAQ